MDLGHSEHVEKELNLLIAHQDAQRRKDEGERATEAIAKDTAEKMWSSYWEMDYGLDEWDHAQECWVDGDDHSYGGSRFGVGSRRPVGSA